MGREIGRARAAVVVLLAAWEQLFCLVPVLPTCQQQADDVVRYVREGSLYFGIHRLAVCDVESQVFIRHLLAAKLVRGGAWRLEAWRGVVPP